MEILKNKFKDLLVIKTFPKNDDRGSFNELFRLSELEKELGYKINFCQENESTSKYGVIRGLHYQKDIYSQAKLIRVTNGKILDVVVDLRKDSDTYKKYFSIELSDQNNLQLFVPKGFAHGFATLSNSAKVIYKVDNYYNKIAESGLVYDDESLKIDWKIPFSDIIISERDKNLDSFKNLKH